MFKIIVISAAGHPSFTIDSALNRFEIADEVARRFGYATLAPFAGCGIALPHSWLAVDAA